MERDEIAAKDLNKFELPLARRPPATKKRGGALSFLRAATFMVRRRSDAKKAPPREGTLESDGTWTDLYCRIRPLHVNQFGSSPPPPPIPFMRHESFQDFHDVLLPPPSPCSSTDGMSRYASAEDLRSLDTSDDTVDGNRDGINLKAEEFISRFYEEMRLQRMESTLEQF